MLRILFILLPFFVNAQVLAQTSFFDEADALFAKRVINGKVDYQSLLSDPELPALIELIARADLDKMDSRTEKAFLINAYNLAVINKVVENYPIRSVNEVNGFFTSGSIIIDGTKVSLDKLEKQLLLETYKDPRLHFAVVCGAVSCAPLRNKAFRPEGLQKDLDDQVSIALQNNRLVSQLGNTIYLSKIFEWYKDDFGNKDQIIAFLNRYRKNILVSNVLSEKKVPLNKRDHVIKFLQYDWSLNDTNAFIARGGNNSNRYVVSSTIPKGQSEVKWFNNLYHQKEPHSGINGRTSTFFTSSISALYGWSNHFNIGLSARVRRVHNESLLTGPFAVFSSNEEGQSRNGVTALGPQVRFAPIKKWRNFSIQSAFTFAIGSDLAGRDGNIFIDWDGPSWYTQFFNDYAIGDRFSLFTEVDIIIEEIGKNKVNQLSTPATVIMSYFPIRNMTVYLLANYAPIWDEEKNYYYQLGSGLKYQFTPQYEMELLITTFDNKYLGSIDGSAATYNLGLRANIY